MSESDRDSDSLSAKRRCGVKLGDSVIIRCLRPHREQYNGATGQITTITNRDVVYVAIGSRTPCFYMDELELVEVPAGATV